jgi:hypothetical protein
LAQKERRGTRSEAAVAEEKSRDYFAKLAEEK